MQERAGFSEPSRHGLRVLYIWTPPNKAGIRVLRRRLPYAIWMLATIWLVATGVAIYMATSEKVHIEPRHCVYFFLMAAASFTYGAALAAVEPKNNLEFWKLAGLFLGPTLVAVGWVVTNEVNIRNSRKQHAIDLIMQYFTNGNRIADKDRLNKELPFPAQLDRTKINFDDTTDEFLRCVARELNYFDFLASAILHRDIDEHLLRRVLEPIIWRYCIQFRPYIEHWQAKEPTYWADLTALDHQWKSNVERRAKGGGDS